MDGLFTVKIDTPKGRLVQYFTSRYEAFDFRQQVERTDGATVADFNEFGYKVQKNAKQAHDDLLFFMR